ncbi:MAG: hypothetical protein U5J62_02810 [Desulfurivibrio sp.]|nr:hypothetical protein [Desulfurivibrio sp.]
MWMWWSGCQARSFLLAGLEYELEERLHRPVDIGSYRENMNQFLKNQIDGEAIYA